MLFASAGSAGPWPREPKGVFLSLSAEGDRDGNSHAGLYAEYGLTPRNTLGFEFGRGNTGETRALIWMQRALDRSEGADRWAVSLGIGAIQRDGSILPVGQIGAGWGRGLDAVPVLKAIPGGGWLAAEGRVRIAGAMKDGPAVHELAASEADALAWLTPEFETKAELTLGLRPASGVMLVNQLRLEQRDDTGFSSKFASSIVRDLSGPAKVELGVIAPLSGPGSPALKIGSWLEF
ncbi:MAG TPA: hypothetical protein PLL33_02420 [Paracoccus sp. (in: a-proteobacteria)]|nr:hypothetical protein [Paracoccus sp. (in: a-proteobacteria)]